MMKESCQSILRSAWCALFFLISMRWCYATVTSEVPNCPLNVIEWVFMTIWPPSILSAIAGLLMLATIAVWPSAPRLKHAHSIILLLAFSPLVMGLTGLVHTTELSYAMNWYWHFYTAAMLASGVWWTSYNDPKLLPWLRTTIAGAGLFAALHGWQQHFGGLEDNLQMQLDYARETGTALSPEMQKIMESERVHGNFIDPNIYASFLLLTGPILAHSLYLLGQRCAPPKLSTAILLSAAAIIWGGALFFSSSRGAIIGAGAGFAVAFWMIFAKKLSRKWCVAIIMGLVLATVGIIALANYASNRNLITASIRLEYYATALKIYQQYPVTGAGLGEYFPHHMKLKPWTADEARDPHSLFFSMLSQCGITGAIDALSRLGLPFLLALGLLYHLRHKDRWQVIAAISAWCAWNIHSLFQFNELVITNVAYVAVIGFFVFAQNSTTTPTGAASTTTKRNLLPLVAMAVAAIVGITAISNLPFEVRMEHANRAINNPKVSTATAYQRLQDLVDESAVALWPSSTLTDFCLHHRGYESQALASAQQLVQRAPHRSSFWLRAAKAAHLCGKLDPANQYLETALDWYPTSPNAWLMAALLKLPPAQAYLYYQLSACKATFHSVEPQRVTFTITPHPGATKPFLSPLNQLQLRTRDGKLIHFTDSVK